MHQPQSNQAAVFIVGALLLWLAAVSTERPPTPRPMRRCGACCASLNSQVAANTRRLDALAGAVTKTVNEARGLMEGRQR